MSDECLPHRPGREGQRRRGQRRRWLTLARDPRRRRGGDLGPHACGTITSSAPPKRPTRRQARPAGLGGRADAAAARDRPIARRSGWRLAPGGFGPDDPGPAHPVPDRARRRRGRDGQRAPDRGGLVRAGAAPSARATKAIGAATRACRSRSRPVSSSTASCTATSPSTISAIGSRAAACSTATTCGCAASSRVERVAPAQAQARLDALWQARNL